LYFFNDLFKFFTDSNCFKWVRWKKITHWNMKYFFLDNDFFFPHVICMIKCVSNTKKHNNSTFLVYETFNINLFPWKLFCSASRWSRPYAFIYFTRGNFPLKMRIPLVKLKYNIFNLSNTISTVKLIFKVVANQNIKCIMPICISIYISQLFNILWFWLQLFKILWFWFNISMQYSFSKSCYIKKQ